MRKFLTRILVIALCSSFITYLPFNSQNAEANVSTTVASVYVDAPFVQGSYARHHGGVTENFNNMTSSAGGTSVTSNSHSIVGGTKTSGQFSVFDNNSTFGATSTTETATVGGSGSKFANTNSTGFEISFSTAVKYIGFYWAAGNAGNSVEFYSGSTTVASFSTSNLFTLLGSPPADDNAYRDATDSITATNGSRYLKKYYFGPAAGYSSETPTARSSIEYKAEPYAYVHAFALNDESFDRVKIFGGGFEFDNLTVSTQEVPIRNALVLVNEVTTSLTLGTSAWNFKGVTSSDSSTISTRWVSDSSTVVSSSQISIEQDLSIDTGTITMGRTALFRTAITNTASNTCGTTFTLVDSYTATDTGYRDIVLADNGAATRDRLIRGFCYKWTLDPSSSLGSGAVRPTSSASGTRFNANLESPMIIIPEVAVNSCSGAGTLVNGNFENLPGDLTDQPNTTQGDPNRLGVWHGYDSNSNPKQILFVAGADSNTATHRLNGWRTSATDGYIEIQRVVTARTNPSQSIDAVGVRPASGNFHAELAARQLSTLFQDIATIPGTTIRWSIKHRARSDRTDTMEVRIGSTASQNAQTVLQRRLPNNDVYAVPDYSGAFTDTSTISTSLRNGWTEYRGAYIVPANQTTTRFAFAATGGSSSVGNLLDDIQFSPLIACPATLTVPVGKQVTINPFDIDSSGNLLGNDAIDSYGWSDASVVETITASAGTVSRPTVRSIRYTAPATSGTQTISFQITNPQGDLSRSQYTINVISDSATRAPTEVPVDPRNTIVNFKYPQITSTTASVLACVQQVDSAGTVVSGTLRFDVGTIGTSQSSVDVGNESVTVTNDYSNSITLKGPISAVNRVLDGLWISRSDSPSRFNARFYIRISSVVSDLVLYNPSTCADSVNNQIRTSLVRPIALTQTRTLYVPLKNGRQP